MQGLTIRGSVGKSLYINLCVIYFQQCCLRLSTSPPHAFQYQETATSKSRVADTKPRTKSSRDDLAEGLCIVVVWMAYAADVEEWMDGTDGNTSSSSWELGGKLRYVIEKTASKQLEITKSPCNESNLTVLKFCTSLDPLPPPKSSTQQCL